MSSQFAPVQKRPAYLQVFEAIEREILAGRIEDGDAVPTEAELCRQFGVQRSTVREGMRLLEQSGLVRRLNGRRLTVARPHIDEAAASASRGLERHGVTFIEVWEAISALQPATARLAANRPGDEHLKPLEEVTERLIKARTNADIIQGGFGFLQAMGVATGNRVFAIILRSLNLLTKTSLERVIDDLPNAQQRIIKAQREITAALRAGDGEAAAAWMARHVDDIRRGYEVAGVDLESEVGVFERS